MAQASVAAFCSYGIPLSIVTTASNPFWAARSSNWPFSNNGNMTSEQLRPAARETPLKMSLAAIDGQRV
jgi:hypothetical protein